MEGAVRDGICQQSYCTGMIVRYNEDTNKFKIFPTILGVKLTSLNPKWSFRGTEWIKSIKIRILVTLQTPLWAIKKHQVIIDREEDILIENSKTMAFLVLNPSLTVYLIQICCWFSIGTSTSLFDVVIRPFIHKKINYVISIDSVVDRMTYGRIDRGVHNTISSS